jgi:tRNA threonylcarbamoyladenosine modification (KEOPS) complex Cgi121 subunit
LILELPEVSKHVWISGFNISLGTVDQVQREIQERYPEVCVQLVDLNQVAGSRYLLLATLNATKSFQSKHPISKTLGMEILLYLAASRQINEAIGKVGLRGETSQIAALAVGATPQEVASAGELLGQLLKQPCNDELVDQWTPHRVESVESVFGIGKKELKAALRKDEKVEAAVERLAIERSAMLTIKK